jgi:mono/diheme cytochrome c family protein
MTSFSRVGMAILLCAVALRAQNVSQGVYTEAQAKRGQGIYQQKCASCHGDALGGQIGPPLRGDDFLAVWSKEPVFTLAGKIRNTMPPAEAGTLTASQTADILAYILQSSKFPAGRDELRGDEALKQITWPATSVAQAKPAPGAAQAPSFPPAGNLNQVMRGILFPSSNIIFTVQTVDPGAKPDPANATKQEGGFNWMAWGAGIYQGWEMVDYAAIALAESAPLMLTPGRRCENGRPVPVNDPEWIKYTVELAEAGKAAYKASQSRNQDAVSEISGLVSDSCLNCHQVFRNNRAGRCLK